MTPANTSPDQSSTSSLREEMSKPQRIRIRKGGFGEESYLNRKGRWGAWKHAAIFTTQAAAESFAGKYGITDYGLF